MPRGTPKFKTRDKFKLEFKEGKWYGLSVIDELPAAAIRECFRKPVPGEKTPDGITYDTERDAEMADYDICTKSLRITLIYEYNK